jgi:cytochrome c oxidase subunit I
MTAPARTLAASDGGVMRAAIGYMLAGFAGFLLMGVLGLMMRLAQGGLLALPPEWFYRIMTLHGSGMVASVLLAAFGGLAAALSGTTRLDARTLWIALLIYLLGTGFVDLATLLGGFAAGWTVLHPLPFTPQEWSLAAALQMYAGYLLVATGMVIFCAHVLIATSKSYGGITKVLAWRFMFTGGRQSSGPLPRPVELIAAVIAIDGLIAGLAGAVYVLPLFAEAAGLVGNVDALFAKNFVLLFGHTIANLSIYVAAGLVYAVLPLYTGREWKTTWPVAVAWNLIIVLMLANYSHHIYQDFAQPVALQLLGEIGSYAVGLPSFIVTIVGALTLMYGSRMRWTVTTIFVALGLWGWVFGGLGALLDATIPINQVMHNTMWVPAHFHTYYLLGAVAFSWAYMHHVIATLSHAADSGVSRAAAWLYGIGGAGFVLMFFIAGANSVPRRYAVHPAQWQIYPRIAVPFVLLLAVSLTWLTWIVLRNLGPAWRETRSAAQAE